MRLLLILTFWAFGFTACNRPQSSETHATAGSLLTEAQALTIAHQIASQNGRDINRYEIDPFPNRLSENRKEFGFYFLCAPAPAPPGCGFSVHVNRQSGSATFTPGQ